LSPKTPRRTLPRALFDQLFRVRVTVVIEDHQISSARRLTSTTQRANRTIKLDRFVTNVFLPPMPLRIAAPQITNLQVVNTARFDLVEKLNLIRRRYVSQYENLHAAFTRRSLMNNCDSPTHASTT